MESHSGPVGAGEVLHLSLGHVKDGQAVKSALESIFARNGFIVNEFQPEKLLVTPDIKVIEFEAMQMELRKRLTPEAQIEQGIEYDEFDASVRDAFDKVDSPDFFSPAELSMLTHRLLSFIKVCYDLLVYWPSKSQASQNSNRALILE